MSTRMKRARRIEKEKGLIAIELFRSDVLEYTMVYYDLSDGDPSDPATQTDRRVAVFPSGKAPEDLQKAVNKELDGSSYARYFDGLSEALLDDICEVQQESDYEAKSFRREERKLMEPTREYDWATKRYTEHDGTEYETFLEAIETVSEDDTDEAAWTIIDKWRARQLRTEER